MERSIGLDHISLEESVAVTQRTVGAFRDYYSSGSQHEITAVNLIAHHDSSIHFTNSTTSVMKPYLTGEFSLQENPIYLTQPAMGTQGIRHWLSQTELGPFASYFYSMGALYTPQAGEKALHDFVTIASAAWGIEQEDLIIQGSVADIDLLKLAQDNDSTTVQEDSGDIASYRHQYGLGTITGRNINMFGLSKGTSFGLGNLTLIEDTATGAQIAWEVSFDSAPVAACMSHVTHPIASQPAASLYGGDKKREVTDYVAADCANIVSALALEGLEPVSRGKSGLLRKFFKTYVTIAKGDEKTSEEALAILDSVTEAEQRVRQHSTGNHVTEAHMHAAHAICKKWVSFFYEEVAKT